MFAGFCVYAYRKFIRYEEEGVPEAPTDSGSVTEIPAGLLPERPTAGAASDDSDPAMREYNAYLAELAAADKAPRRSEQDHRMTAPESPEAHIPPTASRTRRSAKPFSDTASWPGRPASG